MKRNIPKFAQMYEVLRRQIDEGFYKEGDFIPSEPELERIFGVSRTTVRKAIDMLISDQTVMPKQGKGTTVLGRKTVQRLNHVTSFMETLEQKGFEVTTSGTVIERIIPPAYVSQALQLDSRTKVVKIRRIRMINGHPIAFMVNYLLESIIPFIENEAKNMNSLYQLLEEKYNIEITSSIEFIGAKAASPMEAEMLQIEEGNPLLTSKRTTYSRERPIEYVATSVVADKYEYCIYSQGRE